MKIELYQKERCPFSEKVRTFIDRNRLRSRVGYRFTDHNGLALAKLMDLTSEEKVPVLVVDGKPVEENDQIIKWLDEHLVHASKVV